MLSGTRAETCADQAAVSWRLRAPGAPVLRRPAGLMGVVNCTPDSFSDGGRWVEPGRALAHAGALVAAGAAWIDIGAESSRPGAAPVAGDEELARLAPLLERWSELGADAHLSVDTRKAAVARRALAAGAAMINDISAGADAALLEAVAEAGAAICLMHMRGEPDTMQDAPRYHDVVGEVIDFLAARMERAERAGIPRAAIVLDPGIGFGKTLAHNIALLAALPRIERSLQRPVLVGISRKRLLAALAGEQNEAVARDADSHLLHVQLASRCALLRVHDVAGAARALRFALPADTGPVT